MKRKIIKKYLDKYPTYTTGQLIHLLQKEEKSFFGAKYDTLKTEINRTRRKIKNNPFAYDDNINSQQSYNLGGNIKHTETIYENNNDNTKFIDKRINENIKTLEDLVRVCNIDTNIWEITKWECSVYEGQAKDENEKIQINSFYRVKAYLKKRIKLIETNNLKEELINEIKLYSPYIKKIKYDNSNSKNKNLFEINIFDLHLGKLAWDKEVGADYDIYIAEELYLNAIESLLKKVPNLYDIEQIIFPIGNDFFNTDNKFNTTANGTLQDEDTRWKKTFKKGRELLVKAIDFLYQVAPVTVINIEGNHDTERSFYVGDALECYYFNNKNVIIDNRPTARKYYHYGNCLIGYTHGNNEKFADLPLIMASENPQQWAESMHREWHLGHYHTKRDIKWISTDEFKGVTVRFLSSLTAPDAWHYSKGYINNARSAEAFVWHKENGLEHHLFHTLNNK